MKRCSRCREEMSIIERKYVNDEIICEKCYEKAKESGEVVVEEGKESYISVTILRTLDIIYLVVSLVTIFNNLNSSSGSTEAEGAFLAIIYILLIFFAIWVLTVMFDVVIKIYMKLK